MIKFIHIRTGLKGGITIGYKLELTPHFRRVTYAVARCNSKENYNKKIGRAVTTGRLHAGHTRVFAVADNNEKIVDIIIRHAGV